jgi:hypothetical protein
VDTAVVDVFYVRREITTDPIAYRFDVAQHDGMSLACWSVGQINTWEGTEPVPPCLHTLRRSNELLNAVSAANIAAD